MEKAFVTQECMIHEKAWLLCLLSHSEREINLAEAEIWVRDEKIAMLQRPAPCPIYEENVSGSQVGKALH